MKQPDNAQKPPARRRLQNIADVMTTVLILVATVFVILRALPANAGRSAPTSTPVPDELVVIAPATATPTGPRAVMIEFSDPECPYCVRYSRDIAPTLSEEYRGKVRFAFHHLVNAQTRPLAFQAAVAAECAGRQARFEEMYLRIFYDPNHDRGTLSQHAGAMHIDMSIFDDCTASEGPAAVNAAVEVARALGVNSTPSFMIGLARGLDKVEVVSTLTGVQPLARFREALDAVLGIPQ